MDYKSKKSLIILTLSTMIGCNSKPANPLKSVGDPYVFETPEDPNAPYVREEWKEWIKQNNHPITSLDSEDFKDLEFLDKFLENKSIVQLGEVAHGIAEQNRLRVRLIKYLHQKLGFNVIVFESGFYECSMMNNQIESLTPLTSLKNSLYSFWCTTDLLDLFKYIKQSHRSENKLNLCGLDIQPTGDYITTRSQFLRNVILSVDSVFANQIYAMDSMLLSRSYSGQKIFIQKNYQLLLTLYNQYLNLIEANESLLMSNSSPEIMTIIKQVVRSALAYVKFRNGDLCFTKIGRTNIRDGHMAETLKFIIENLYPDQKTIIWAHNIHTHKDSYTIKDHLGNRKYSIMMGDLLNYNYPNEYHAIGTLSYRGSINYGIIPEIKITRNEAIEAILYQARKRQLFLNLSNQVQTDGNSWIFQSTFQLYLHRSGEYEIQYIPKDQYDGLLFIDTVSEPKYLY